MKNDYDVNRSSHKHNSMSSRTATKVPEYTFDDEVDEADMDYPFVFHDSFRNMCTISLIQKLRLETERVIAAIQKTKGINDMYSARK